MLIGLLITLFVVDFYISVIVPVMKYNRMDHALLSTMRMGIIWALLVSLTMISNEHNLKKNKEDIKYEQVTEPLYKLKQQ